MLPFIVISSTVKVVSVPKEVIFDCAAPVTVAAVPDTFPVTSPVNGPAKASAVTVPSKNASLNSTELVPKSISLFVDGTIAPSVNVTWLDPPAAIVITLDPLNVMLVSVSPSPAIESSCTAPTFDNAASPKSTAPATVSVPDTSTLPFISTVVAAICISVSATKSNWPSVDELIYIAVSLNCNFSVVDNSISSENWK